MGIKLLIAVQHIFSCYTAHYPASFGGYTDTKQCLADSFIKFVKLIIYKPSLCIINEIKACFNVRACKSVCNACVR